jgi:tight adherence protein C
MMVHLLGSLGERVPVSETSAAIFRRELIGAGYRSEAALSVLVGARTLLCGAGAAAGLLLGDWMAAAFLHRVVLVAAGGSAGWLAPGWVLYRRLRARRERLRLALPDALDLMVVCVEAGLALDQALANVCRELRFAHPDICDELEQVLLEMRAGKRRAEALHHLAERTGEEEIRKLVAILIQADRFGASIGESLRVHAEFMRIQRRQDAEERAGKVGVKLVFPIFFCIMPAMLIVTAGPGLLQIVKYLLPMMRTFNQ